MCNPVGRHYTEGRPQNNPWHLQKLLLLWCPVLLLCCPVQGSCINLLVRGAPLSEENCCVCSKSRPLDLSLTILVFHGLVWFSASDSLKHFKPIVFFHSLQNSIQSETRTNNLKILNVLLYFWMCNGHLQPLPLEILQYLICFYYTYKGISFLLI